MRTPDGQFTKAAKRLFKQLYKEKHKSTSRKPDLPGLINFFTCRHSDDYWTNVYVFKGHWIDVVKELIRREFPLHGWDVPSYPWSPTGYTFAYPVDIRLAKGNRVVITQNVGLDC